MPKSIIVDPKEVRKKDTIKIKDIPVNQYKPDFEKEKKKYGEDGLKRMYWDMLLIREFETMLNEIKQRGNYQGIEYNHRGPAHLSMGQESSSVGQAYNLDRDDFIFGSHRSHGEILSKCFSAIAKLKEKDFSSIMESYLDGSIYKVVEEHHKGEDFQDLAENYILYGTLAEIFAKENGINKGLGGSMHAFFAPLGSMPNNAIVGGSGDISVGSALFKRINREPGIVIGNIGDASMGCGPVWEGMMIAAMDQYTTLWDKEIGGAPPIMINFFNNFYGMGGQTAGETMGYKVLARVGAGVNPDNMHSERVDGYNPLAVADAVERKKKILKEGKGPVLMDTVTYRLSGHSPSDAMSYRTKEELALWEEDDCIKEFGEYLKSNKVLSKSDLDSMKEKAVEKISTTMKLAIDMDISPRAEGKLIEDVMFSNQKVEKFAEKKPEVLISKEENPRVKSLSKKSRYGLDEKGKPLSANKVFALRDGLFEAMLHRF